MTFTERDVKYAQSIFEALGLKYHVSIETLESENDSLDIDGATIQKVISEVPAIIPRKAVQFIVSIPYVIPGNYWEPDYPDIKEIATVDNFHAALCELYLQDCTTKFYDAVQGVSYVEQTEEV